MIAILLIMALPPQCVTDDLPPQGPPCVDEYVSSKSPPVPANLSAEELAYGVPAAPPGGGWQWNPHERVWWRFNPPPPPVVYRPQPQLQPTFVIQPHVPLPTFGFSSGPACVGRG